MDTIVHGEDTAIISPPPLECTFGHIHIPFSRRWDRVRYSGSGIQLDIRYSYRYLYLRIRLDTVGYSGIQRICCKMERQI